jgi:hypothetical protein
MSMAARAAFLSGRAEVRRWAAAGGSRTLVRAGQPDIVQVEGICANFNVGAADAPAHRMPARTVEAGNKK